MIISRIENTDEIVKLAMSDELFAPESISLEPEGKSLTVRLPEKEKHFIRKHLATIPTWNDDIEVEKECLLI